MQLVSLARNEHGGGGSTKMQGGGGVQGPTLAPFVLLDSSGTMAVL